MLCYRFVSRSFSGFLIVWIGFDRTAAVASALQCGVVLATLLYFVLCECSIKSNRAAVHWKEVTRERRNSLAVVQSTMEG